ncbi:MAG TPA: hypothetical protein VNW06_05985 [Cytophagaceae bacterium]|jgi:hypothetical protein|nr:hypothetical protein [Cytophagaceae bacterium]
MEVHLKIIGILLLLLALIHIIFPKYFDWEKELSSLSLVNKQLMHVHTFFIALVVFMIGIFCLSCTDDIIRTRLGHNTALGLSVFWGIRLIFQFFVYSPKLWKGKLLETIIHYLFAVIWTYFTVVFFLIYNS